MATRFLPRLTAVRATVTLTMLMALASGQAAPAPKAPSLRAGTAAVDVTPRQFPFIYAGGIDPVVRGADPELSGKNAVMISELAGGYWIFSCRSRSIGCERKNNRNDVRRPMTGLRSGIRQAAVESTNEARMAGQVKQGLTVG